MQMAYFNSLYSSFMCYGPLEVPSFNQALDGTDNPKQCWAINQQNDLFFFFIFAFKLWSTNYIFIKFGISKDIFLSS